MTIRQPCGWRCADDSCHPIKLKSGLEIYGSRIGPLIKPVNPLLLRSQRRAN
jgi:hypothetical protein